MISHGTRARLAWHVLDQRASEMCPRCDLPTAVTQILVGTCSCCDEILTDLHRVTFCESCKERLQ